MAGVCLWPVAVAVVIMAIVLGGYVAGRTKRRRSEAKRRPVPPEPAASGRELLAKKFALEQQMAGIAGGSTGMFVLLDLIRDCPAGGDSRRYQDSYRSRQKKLQGYVEEYCGILAQAEGLPPEERSRFVPDEDLERYRMLADMKI